MSIRDPVRSAFQRLADALALVAMALRAPTAPPARLSCEHLNTPLQGAGNCGNPPPAPPR
jgi:hypothetical protein